MTEIHINNSCSEDDLEGLSNITGQHKTAGLKKFKTCGGFNFKFSFLALPVERNFTNLYYCYQNQY